MTLALDLLLILLSLAVLLPALVLCVETAFARERATGGDETDAQRRPGIAVLVPAHDEAAGISATLHALRPQLAAGDRLLVVADNCSDATAAVAARAGAEVVERHDPTRRGKGYALAFGLAQLAADPREVVIVCDADCRIEGLERLARRCAHRARPVQALYLMHSSEPGGALTRLAQFAWTVRNRARPLGLHRLGLPCQLMGSGMAFPWGCLRPEQLAGAEIVEDLALGVALARDGLAPEFCPQVRVTSHFPIGRRARQRQRTRWEHGHLGVLLAQGPRLLALGLARGETGMIALALDLLVPPLSLLLLLTGSVWLAAAAFWLATRGLGAAAALPSVIATLACLLLLSAVLIAWWRFGRRMLPLHALLAVGAYAVAKVPLYLRFLWARQLQWVRTERDLRPRSRGL